jgi:hypothetical protein
MIAILAIHIQEVRRLARIFRPALESLRDHAEFLAFLVTSAFDPRF